jgi:trimethylamine:corrinoid methyltransferase-like protein
MVKGLGMHWRSAHVGGAPFTIEQMMKNAKTAQDSARIQGFAERMKNAVKPLNLKENYQELADKAAEGGISYLVCSSIPVGTMEEIKTAVEVFNKTGEACKKVGCLYNQTLLVKLTEGIVRSITFFPIPIRTW